jgi:lipopolysaccharide transport system ATP-binding protein
MVNHVISAQNIGKKYQLGIKEPYKTLSETITNSIFRYRSDRLEQRKNISSGEFWALRHLSFDIEKGEILGIIGQNGAGKSTLLKILSRITTPTEGTITLNGRVGSLLEVGTGFHPELTGRENIFLSGSILGMKKTEIDQQFDNIVKFCEIEQFLDTPVKRYSSGMYVRLGFAVAAHLNTEILLVDEVLAVGDVAFQKKCLDKMGQVTNEGRTVLFVSHNMGAVGRLCQKGMLLNKGSMQLMGDIESVITRYITNIQNSCARLDFENDSKKIIQILQVSLQDEKGNLTTTLNRELPFFLKIEFKVKEFIEGAHIAVMLDKADGFPIYHFTDFDILGTDNSARIPGIYQSIIKFPGGLLNSGSFQLRIGIARQGGMVYDYCDAFFFQLIDFGSSASIGAEGKQRLGLVTLPVEWETDLVNNV